MKYRAVCPHCGHRFSRRMSILNMPHVRRKCQQCGGRFRAVAWSEYLGDTIVFIVVMLPVILALQDYLPWLVAICLTTITLLLLIYSWPYVTSFEKVAPGKGRDA